MLSLKVLVDNNTLIDRYFYGEPGLSYLITEGETKLLFDVGYSDLFIRNAQKMSESLMDLDYLAISHGHLDHTWGLLPLIRHYAEAVFEGVACQRPTVIAHPEAFVYKEFSGDEIGSVLEDSKMEKHFTMRLTSEPLWITDTLVFLGEIPRANDFENKEPIGRYACAEGLCDDYVRDDSALAYKSPQGLVVITGCSHAGICNIIEYAKTVCGDNRIIDVVGGFHLLDLNQAQEEGTLNYFKEQGIKQLHPCHCTGLEYKIKLAQYSTVSDVGVGLSLSYR